jgi:hypothetical protein
MTTRIQTQAELLALTSRRARRGVFRVEVNVPGYSRDVRRLQHQLNRSLRTRGWAMAFLFLLAGLVALALWTGLMPGQPGHLMRHPFAAGVTVLFALGVSGKFAGRWRAERRLRRALTEYRV